MVGDIAASPARRPGVSEEVALFSYGTLQLPAVQRATYGRLLEGQADALPGYRLQPLEISDLEVVRLSGKAVHSIAVATDDVADRVAGMVFRLSQAELDATDAYEVDAYGRVETRLESGRTAWVYVGAATGP
ncbi:gamma-glutamylcyclotransferase family protein [Sphingomonas sp. URHD0057]|uniref:gamma-glutamylcyclotransferase family protein n=1 Tax=Sphingomonas sp. URHD0057 TaxID=1380389 RepID=UPI0006891CF6|nr:gamma-glutamylcyclotransferase family protein [Sphingomonas sp. URHD0057]